VEIKMTRLNNREKKFIIIGIIIIVASLTYAYFFYPLYIEINTLTKEYYEKQGIMSRLAEIEATVEMLEKEIDASVSILDKIEARIL